MEKIYYELDCMKSDIEQNKIFTKDDYKARYNYLSDNIPTLFDLVYKGDESYKRQLDFMISYAKKINNDGMPQYDADVKVGQRLAEDYIYPNIDMDKEKLSK